MEGQLGLSELSVILWVSVKRGSTVVGWPTLVEMHWIQCKYSLILIHSLIHSHTSQSYIPANSPKWCTSRKGSFILSSSHWNTASKLPVAVEAIWAGGWAGWVAEPLQWRLYLSGNGNWTETYWSQSPQCWSLSVCGFQLCRKHDFTVCQP